MTPRWDVEGDGSTVMEIERDERRNPAIERDFEQHGHHPDCYCTQCCLDRM